jgi:hypothetical protein
MLSNVYKRNGPYTTDWAYFVRTGLLVASYEYRKSFDVPNVVEFLGKLSDCSFLIIDVPL